MKLQSVTKQVINDGGKGQISENITVEIRQIAIHNNGQMEYNGEVVTGVTTIVPEFFIEYNDGGKTERLTIKQGVPTVVNFPTAVINSFVEQELPKSGVPLNFGERETYILLFALRRILARETQSPLFGLSQETDWDVVTD